MEHWGILEIKVKFSAWCCFPALATFYRVFWQQLHPCSKSSAWLLTFETNNRQVSHKSMLCLIKAGFGLLGYLLRRKGLIQSFWWYFNIDILKVKYCQRKACSVHVPKGQQSKLKTNRFTRAPWKLLSNCSTSAGGSKVLLKKEAHQLLFKENLQILDKPHLRSKKGTCFY